MPRVPAVSLFQSQPLKPSRVSPLGGSISTGSGTAAGVTGKTQSKKQDIARSESRMNETDVRARQKAHENSLGKQELDKTLQETQSGVARLQMENLSQFRSAQEIEITETADAKSNRNSAGVEGARHNEMRIEGRDEATRKREDAEESKAAEERRAVRSHENDRLAEKRHGELKQSAAEIEARNNERRVRDKEMAVRNEARRNREAQIEKDLDGRRAENAQRRKEDEMKADERRLEDIEERQIAVEFNQYRMKERSQLAAKERNQAEVSEILTSKSEVQQAVQTAETIANEAERKQRELQAQEAQAEANVSDQRYREKKSPF